MLRDKSLTDLRGIAQSYDIADIFQKDVAQLVQAIELRQEQLQPKPKVVIPKPAYDARLMTKIPAKKSEQQMIEELLEPYVTKGLKISFPEPEVWAMSFGKRNDTGSMRIPPRIILKCADKVLIG